MKKLVLIPHERYEQFLVREAKESSVQQPESLENHSVEQETSTKPQEKRVEQVAEEEKEEKPSTSQEVEINSTRHLRVNQKLHYKPERELAEKQRDAERAKVILGDKSGA